MQAFIAAICMTLCLVFGVILRYIPFRNVISKKRKKVLFICYGAGFAINILLLTLRFFQDGVSVAMIRIDGVAFAFGMAVINLIVIGKKIREQFYTFGMIIVCNYMLVSVPEYISAHHHWLSGSNEFYFYTVVYFLLLVVTFYPMMRLVKATVEPFLSRDYGDYWTTIWYIPIVLFLPLFFAVPIDTAGEGDMIRLISRVLIVIANISLGVSIAKDYRYFNEKQVITDQLADQKVYYTELQTKVGEARKARHDMKHFIAAVYQFIDHDDKEGLRAFCDDLSDRNSMDRDAYPYTGNVAVDGVVYKYVQLCMADNIDFNYSGTVKSGKIADVDICVLVGNALDNAYAACKELNSERKISLMCQSENQLLTIMVQNSFDGKIETTEDDQLISRKRGDRPGVGMLSMNSVCQRYGGTMERHWDENTFTVMFMLPLE
ncbi:MAG: sensor histidine kinase [Clostridia bacterium]|nr:sensor histidine kinase [Clostridia bacterium]